MTQPDPVFFLSLALPGSACAVAALVLRRAEERHPDPDDYLDRGGMRHLLVGLLSSVALMSLVFLTLFLSVPLATALAALVFALPLMPHPGTRLIPFYRLQMSLAVAALLAALALWLSILHVIQGEPNV